jgi:hypothetical protein
MIVNHLNTYINITLHTPYMFWHGFAIFGVFLIRYELIQALQCNIQIMVYVQVLKRTVQMYCQLMAITSLKETKGGAHTE